MGEKEYHTNEVEEEMSLSGQLSRRRRQRQMAEDGNYLVIRDDRVSTESTGNTSDPKDVSDQDHRADRTEDAKTQADKKIRITMLGISGSGKTAFLSGVYQTMIMDSFHGLSLVSSVDSDNSYRQIGQIADIALINRKDYDFADGTLETTIFPLTLQNKGTDVCRFDFTDYAGGDVLELLNVHGDLSSGAKLLKGQLLGSDAVMVFADATMLCQGKNVVEWQQLTGATRINPLFNLLIGEMGHRPLTVLFVLTKTDDERIPKEMKRNNFAILAERAVQTFGMIYQMVQNHVQDGWSFGVIPVSAIGEGNYRLTASYDSEGKQIMRPVVKAGHAPQSYNIETALVYAVACILSQWKKDVNQEREELNQRLIKEGRNNTIIGNLFSQWKRKARPEEKVTSILNEIEEKNKEMMMLSEQVNDLVEQAGIRRRIQKYSDHLDESRGISG